MTERLGSAVHCYKVGLELLFGGGIEFARELKAAGNSANDTDLEVLKSEILIT